MYLFYRDTIQISNLKNIIFNGFFSSQFEFVISRLVKIKNIKKQNLLYGCFKNNPHKR